MSLSCADGSFDPFCVQDTRVLLSHRQCVLPSFAEGCEDPAGATWSPVRWGARGEPGLRIVYVFVRRERRRSDGKVRMSERMNTRARRRGLMVLTGVLASVVTFAVGA